MKKRTIRTLALLLAAVLAIPATLVSAGAVAVADAVNAADASDPLDANPAYKDGWLYLAYKNISTYSIVHSSNAKVVVKARCQELRETFETWTTAPVEDEEAKVQEEDLGARLPVVEDASKLTANEIIIGQTGRLGRKDLEEIALANGIEVDSASFMIQVTEDGDVLVIGGHQGATEVAVNYLVDRILEVNRNGRYIAIQKGYSYIYHHGTSQVPVVVDEKGSNELRFTLDAYTMNDVFCRLVYAGNNAWRIQNKYSFITDFDDIGAAQYVSTCIGEDPAVTKEALTYEEPDENTIKVIAPNGSYALLHTDVFSLEFYTASGKLAQRVTDLDYYNAYGTETSTLRFEIDKDKPIYGTGGRFDSVNQYGKLVTLYTTNMEDSTSGAYAVVPLFSRTNGAGIFINRNEYMVADIGSTNKTDLTITITSGMIDCYVFTTEQISDVIDSYCSISGYASLPEDWTYGMLVCRGNKELATKDGVYSMIAKMEQYSLPWTGVILEDWNLYSEKTHADLTEICEYVHSLGKKVLIYATVGNYTGANRDKYYMIKYKYNSLTQTMIPHNPDATVQFNPTEVSGTGSYYLDLTNPDAVEWFFGEYWEYLMTDIGVDGVKLDYGERITDTVGTLLFYDADMKTAGTHHWYSSVFANLVWKVISSKPDSGMCYISGAAIGTQRAPYVWSGDQTLVFNRLQRQLTSLLSGGLSGFAFTSTDIAGNAYKDGEVLDIDEEAAIFLRAVQFTAFTACMETSGVVRRPYDYVEYTEDGEHPYAYVTDIYKVYTMLHDALAPYLNEYSEIAVTTGMPLVRHLILQYQNDPNVYDIKDEFLLGDAFLVAPILNKKTSRSIYLPEGTWLDLNTGKTVVGGQTLKNYKASMAEIPVFYLVDNTSETAGDVVETVKTLLQYVKTIELPE